MPSFSLETNISSKHIPDDFLSKCVLILSKMTGKPEMFTVAYILPNQDMALADSTDACGIVNLSSIGGLGVEDNKKYCHVFSKLIEEHVGISRKRLWMIFTENLPEYVAFKGKSFYHITMCRPPGEPVIHDPDE